VKIRTLVTWLKLTSLLKIKCCDTHTYLYENTMFTNKKDAALFGNGKRWVIIENWLEPKTEPPSGNSACLIPWNALYLALSIIDLTLDLLKTDRLSHKMISTFFQGCLSFLEVRKLFFLILIWTILTLKIIQTELLLSNSFNYLVLTLHLNFQTNHGNSKKS